MKAIAVIGLTFEIFYNENNVNNIKYCEIRAIVDEKVIVIFCRKKDKEFYKMIDINEFNYKIENEIIKL
jgi:hypothetical protein